MPHLHKLAGLLIVCAVIVGLFAPTHHAAPRRGEQAGALAKTGSVKNHLSGKSSGQRAPVRHNPSPKTPPVDPVQAARDAKANELGEVPVLMYHRILSKPQASLDRTPKELRDELTRLATEGYVPVTAAEFVSSRMDIPAGTHPVVLTFDDGSETHFGFDAQGNPRPDTAVAILMQVASEHRGFRPVATFYVNKDPFVLGPRTAEGLRWLTQRGFEIANHTTRHLDLSKMSRRKVQEEIGTDQKAITDVTGLAPTTFAFPFGALSHLSWADHGEAGGAKWDFAGMFLAGWKPADSPFTRGFDTWELPRIRSEGRIKEDDCKKYCSTAWLDWLNKHADKRYTSDGDPAVISFPQSKAKFLNQQLADRARPYQ